MLIDPLPTTVTVAGREIKINSDFRAGVLFEMLIFDQKVSDRQKVEQIIDIYFGKTKIPNVKEAVDAILTFYRCERRENKIAAKSAKEGQKRIYDFDEDDRYIYAAFLSQYGIDLNDVEMHWWKFQALFGALDENQKITKIMGYRAADLSKIKDKKERERIAYNKSLYALPNAATHEEKVARAASIFAGGI